MILIPYILSKAENHKVYSSIFPPWMPWFSEADGADSFCQCEQKEAQGPIL